MLSGKLTSISWEDLRIGTRFFVRLPAFLRKKWSPEEAKNEILHRLQNRGTRFLSLIQRSIFQNNSSPYLKLMKMAGCEYGDLATMVKADGVESSLKALRKEGVYLSVEEFKGRVPIKRGSFTLQINPQLLKNPLSRFHVSMKSGGSRSQGTSVVFDLDFIRECAANTGLALYHRGGKDWLKATWEVPGGGALFSLLEFSQFGREPNRWFSQLNPKLGNIHPRYIWSNRVLKWSALIAGKSMPNPQYVPLSDPSPIVAWMQTSLISGKIPYLLSYPSSALRVCRKALEKGIDLTGARFTIAGEPCTRNRLEFIRSTGAEVLPKYGIMETGPVGYGCLNPQSSDDIHLLHDLHAVIQPEDDTNPQPLFFTSLMTSAPIVLFNVSMGDRAIMKTHKCNCLLEQCGWATHLLSIQSQEKLTCGGMNFLDTDIIRILDDVLPSIYGGSPTDYQLVEETGKEGEPALKLLVHPHLGKIDDQKLMETFIKEICQGEDVNTVMGLTWKQGQFIQVVRQEPQSTNSGKILHLHVETTTSQNNLLAE